MNFPVLKNDKTIQCDYFHKIFAHKQITAFETFTGIENERRISQIVQTQQDDSCKLGKLVNNPRNNPSPIR
jgi:23S rRNA C2498 (ribose-2'-O)-methylase RlmM